MYPLEYKEKEINNYKTCNLPLTREKSIEQTLHILIFLNENFTDIHTKIDISLPLYLFKYDRYELANKQDFCCI